jgi:hypothetical protein
MSNREMDHKLSRPFVAPLVFLLFALFIGLAQFLSKQVQPWRYAAAVECLATDTTRGAYRNSCDYPINFGYAVLAGQWPKPQLFVFTTLEPGEIETDWFTSSQKVGKNERFWFYACRTPHVPGLRTSYSNQSITQSDCRRNPETHPSKADLRR